MATSDSCTISQETRESKLFLLTAFVGRGKYDFIHNLNGYCWDHWPMRASQSRDNW